MPQQAQVRKHGSAFPSGCTHTYENWLSPVTKQGAWRWSCQASKCSQHAGDLCRSAVWYFH